ncbi:MAG: tetratricopeptide repeat protein [Myxococcota bacterium]
MEREPSSRAPGGVTWSTVTELLRSGELDRAEKALDVVSVSDPNGLNAALVRARIAWARGQLKVAVNMLRRAANQFPKSSAVQVTLADLYLELDRPELALEAAAVAERLDPSETGRVVISRVRKEIHEHLFDWGDSTSTGSRALDATQFSAELDAPEAMQWSDAAPGTFEDRTVPMGSQHPAPTAGPPARPSLAPTAALAERAQVRALLVGDLFDGVEASTKIYADRTKKKGDLPRKVERLVFLTFVASFAVGGASLATVGVERSAQLKVDATANDLRHLLQNGSLDHVPALLSELERAAEQGGVQKRYEDLFALAHGMLWRFHDDAPEHLERLKRAEAEVADPSLERRMARAVLWIDTRPKDVIADMKKVAELAKESPHPPELIALAACKLKDPAVAEPAFAKAEELEPPHLPYLYAQLQHWVGRKKLDVAEETLDRMMDVNPKAAWTQLGRALLGQATEEEIQALIDAEETPPLVRKRAINMMPKGEIAP